MAVPSGMRGWNQPLADCDLSYFLELRLRLRGNREGLAIVDRCLALIARASTADDAMLVELDREVVRLADELALRFGAPRTAVFH